MLAWIHARAAELGTHGSTGLGVVGISPSHHQPACQRAQAAETYVRLTCEQVGYVGPATKFWVLYTQH